MIITDYNKMTIEELRVIHEYLGVSYVIENGKIVCTAHMEETNEK